MVGVARNELPIVVAGGGIGGLACALALAKKRFRVAVLEQAPEFGEVGVGLQVAPNALSVLDALGVGGAVKKNSLLIERMLMMDAVTGEEVANIPCGDRFRERFGNPYAVAHRADVHGALLDACRAHDLVTLRINCTVAGFDFDGSTVSVALQNGERVKAAALVGADGVASQIRRHMFDDGELQPAGAVIYRATIPVDAMPRDLQHPYPTLWVGPGWHVIYYPIRDWKMFNLGCTLVTSQNALAASEDVAANDVIGKFAGGCETTTRVMGIPKQFRRYVIVHKEPIDNWTLGSATLLGDAAHPMVQYLAQGAAMALEDAICLAVTADEHDGDFERSFQAYQDVRIVRTARVQISSLMMDRLNHAKGVERMVRNSLFAGRKADEFYDRLAWLYTPPSFVTAALAS